MSELLQRLVDQNYGRSKPSPAIYYHCIGRAWDVTIKPYLQPPEMSNEDQLTAWYVKQRIDYIAQQIGGLKPNQYSI